MSFVTSSFREKVPKLFTHVRAPRITVWGRPVGSPERLALSPSETLRRPSTS